MFVIFLCSFVVFNWLFFFLLLYYHGLLMIKIWILRDFNTTVHSHIIMVFTVYNNRLINGFPNKTLNTEFLLEKINDPQNINCTGRMEVIEILYGLY